LEKVLPREKKIALFLLLLYLPVALIPAQTETDEPPAISNNPRLPQWVRDIRRFEIIAFGTFPFTMLVSTFGMDMHRWSRENGRNFSAEGRRYAPWPLKSAGAIAMESEEQKRTIFIAIGLSLTAAMTDLIIVQIKRQRERKRAAAIPESTVIITRTPIHDEPEEPDNSEAIYPEPEPSSP
jgi:hypothetical protein